MTESHAPVANVITLGTLDLPSLREFYRLLGWPVVVDGDDFAAFELRGTVLALFPVDELAADGRGWPEHRRGGIRLSIGVMVDLPEQVDAMVQLVRRAGGRITKEPVHAEHFEGRSAYFADPEDNYWEIAWAPSDNPILAAAHRAAGIAR